MNLIVQYYLIADRANTEFRWILKGSSVDNETMLWLIDQSCFQMHEYDDITKISQ